MSMGRDDAECIITLTPPPGRGRTVGQRLDAIDAIEAALNRRGGAS